MTKTNKPTKKEMFAHILAHTTDVAEKEFLQHEIDLLNHKSDNKELSENQKANEKLKDAIVNRLKEEAGCKMTVSAMIKMVPECNGLSTSKVSALVRQLKEACVLKREEIKGVAYFSLA